MSFLRIVLIPAVLMGLALVGTSPSASAFGSGGMMASYMDTQLSQRFERADQNHDGRLTLGEAKARMPMVATHFAQIDTEHRGYVTLGQLQTFMHSEMARRAQTSQAQP